MQDGTTISNRFRTRQLETPSVPRHECCQSNNGTMKACQLPNIGTEEDAGLKGTGRAVYEGGQSLEQQDNAAGLGWSALAEL